MLSYPVHIHHLTLHHHNHSATVTVTSSLPHRAHNNNNNPQTTPHDHDHDHDHDHILLRRTHNSKSTSRLIHKLSHSQQHQNPIEPQHHQQQQNNSTTISKDEKTQLLEMSLITKRTPQFPGSIYIQSPTSVDDVTTSLPPLQTLIRRSTSEEGFDEEMIMRALEIRRRVTAEIFKEEMRRKGKFGITYSTNVVEHLPDFIDFVMIKAAALKQLPEFERQSFNVRARAVIEDSTVVKFIRWLKHNRLSYPKIAKLICMSKGNLESIRPIAEWLKTIHVRSEFLGLVLLKSGETILERSRKELDEIVDYLESHGVRREWMGYVMRRCPQLLSYNIDELKSRVEFYVGMGINKNDFGTMVYSYSRALGYYSLDEMSEKVNYLKEFGLNHEEVGRLLAFKPQLMGCSIEERWKPLVKFLYYLGVTRDGMRRMLTIKPMVFCVDMEDTIMPKVRFFSGHRYPR